MKTLVHDWPKYVEGDMFAEIKKAPPGHKILIPHVVNNLGRWGAGFSGPLGEAFPIARSSYEKHIADGWERLGSVIGPFMANESIFVAGMVAQDGVGTQERRVRYNALVQCMELLGRYLEGDSMTIHCPKFGCGLAGGNWDFIEELIRDCWIRRGIKVTVYWLPEKGKAKR